MDRERQLLSTAETADLLGVSVRTVHRMVDDGRLHGERVGTGETSSWAIRREDAERLAHQEESA